MALNDPYYQRLWRIQDENTVPLTAEQIAALPKGGGCGCG